MLHTMPVVDDTCVTCAVAAVGVPLSMESQLTRLATMMNTTKVVMAGMGQPTDSTIVLAT